MPDILRLDPPVVGSKIGMSHAGDHPGALPSPSGHNPEMGPGLPDFAEPRHEGDDRPDSDQGANALQQLLALPATWRRLHTDVMRAAAAIMDAMSIEVWANRNDISNQAQAGTINGGVNAFILALTAHPSQAVELRNVVVGTSAAALVQLAAARSPTLIGSNPVTRNVVTVRTTANNLSVWVAPHIKLEPEENLFLIASLAAVNFDLSCEYRVLRG